MSALPRKQNLWRHGSTRFEHPPMEDLVGAADGIFPMKVLLDADVGEEVVLYWRDQTPFIEELRRVRPFRLMLKTGAGRNPCGPVFFMVFWVPNPADPEEAFAANEAYLNPHDALWVSRWRELAVQSHWHLFLIGAGNEQREFFEFENVFNLDEALDLMVRACGPIPMVDFARAKARFMEENSLARRASDRPAFTHP